MRVIVTSSAIDNLFEIFGPTFEENVTINFEPILEQNANIGPIFEKSSYFGPIFEKKCKFRTFCQWQMKSILGQTGLLRCLFRPLQL